MILRRLQGAGQGRSPARLRRAPRAGRQKKKAPIGGLRSGQVRFPADMEQHPEQTGKQARAAVNYDLHTVPLLFGR